ncbi:transposase [Cyanosarcina cf. burmensis CCALA 770]|nr:transposase [Cyanosarcina cf. burmensis CCALA 770]
MTLFKNKYCIESTRLSNRDYAANGLYFITICTGDRTCFFGDIVNTQIHLSAIGQIAEKFWVEIPQHFKHTYIDAYVVMPNHVHGIIIIDKPYVVSTTCRDVACNVSTDISNDLDDCNFFTTMSMISPKSGSLSAILQSYKSAVTQWCRKNGYDNFTWQPRFYDRIIRADGSLDKIREYIVNNPTKWKEDKNNPSSLWM